MLKKIVVLILAVLAGLLIAALVTGLIPLSFLRGSTKTTSAPHPLEVAYLSPVGEGAGLWSIPIAGGDARMLSRNTGTVLDFAVSVKNGRLAFSAGNNQGGSDLWVVEHDGSGQKLLLRCGADRCQDVSFSPDGAQLAYSRIAAQPAPGEKPDFPHGFLLTLSDSQPHPIVNDPLIGAQFITWSPDGKKLSFYDPTVAGIRVREISSGREVVLPTVVPSSGSWSSDSQSLVYNQEDYNNGFAYVKVYLMDLAAGKPRLLLGSGEDDASDYSLPDWSPDGQWLAFGARTLPGNPAKQIRLIHPDGSGRQTVTDDPSWTHAAYQWSPDGTYLAFQRFGFGSSENVPQIVVWQLSSGQSRMLVQKGAAPKWLP